MVQKKHKKWSTALTTKVALVTGAVGAGIGGGIGGYRQLHKSNVDSNETMTAPIPTEQQDKIFYEKRLAGDLEQLKSDLSDLKKSAKKYDDFEASKKDLRVTDEDITVRLGFGGTSSATQNLSAPPTLLVDDISSIISDVGSLRYNDNAKFNKIRNKFENVLDRVIAITNNPDFISRYSSNEGKRFIKDDVEKIKSVSDQLGLIYSSFQSNRGIGTTAPSR